MLPTPAPSSPGGTLHDDDDDDQHDEDDVVIDVPENKGTYPDFQVLCLLLERLARERKQDTRRRLLTKWFSAWREYVGMDLYPLLRLLLPQKDRERAVYGLKEKALARAFIKALGLDPKSPDAVRLVNWKRPTDKDKAAGDFPTVLLEVVQKRSSVMKGTMRVDQVNACLDDLAACSGKVDKILHVIRRISDSTTPAQQAWIVRIILKDLVISVKETTILSVFHPDALSLFNTCSDLKRVAHQLWDPDHRLHDRDKRVQLFRCFAPMLCKRPTKSLEETVALMKDAKFIIEEKLDGERIQIHKRGNEYRYYSRKGKDYTYLYGQTASAQDASLTPFLAKAFRADVQDCILDGEMLVWDPVSEKLMPFGNLKTAALDKSRADRKARPCFKIFDILFVNGTSLLDKKLAERKKLARKIIKESRGRVEFSFEEQGNTAKDIHDALNKVMEERGEGVVVKHPDSQYQLNGRVSDWIKVKPEYMDDMGETVDVLVVAANYGSGRRGGGVSSFICAVLEDREETDDGEPKYSTFVRIGSGFSYLDYVEIRKKAWKPWDPKKPPAWLITSPIGQDDKGDVYLEPHESFIVKVKAAEITKTDQYGMKLTMRFPRALRIRDDLDVSDCLAASDLLKMTAVARKRKADDDEAPRKKRKTAKKPNSLAQTFKSADTTNVEVTSDIFNGMKFHVIENRRAVDEKKTLETLIKAHGGSYCQKPQPKERSSVFRVYGGPDQIPPTRPVAVIMEQDASDILRPSFIYDSIEKGERQPLRKRYFIHRAGEKDRTEEEDEVYEHDDDMDTAAEVPLPSSSKASIEEEMRKSAQAEAELDALSSQYSEWMVINDKDNSAAAPSIKKEAGDESETQDEWESEAEDAADKAEEWEMVSNGTMASSVANASATMDNNGSQVAPNAPAVLPPTQLAMGDDDAAEYDPDIIFKHLRFYLDTPANARRNDMKVKNNKHENDINTTMTEIAQLIEQNGGKIVDLSDPRLTHVILDARDCSRLKALSERTSTPRRRQLVLTDFITEVVREGTLLDEDAFRP